MSGSELCDWLLMCQVMTWLRSEYQSKFIDRFMSDFPYIIVTDRPSKRQKVDNNAVDNSDVGFYFTLCFSPQTFVIVASHCQPSCFILCRYFWVMCIAATSESFGGFCCLSSAMHSSIGQNIKSFSVFDVRCLMSNVRCPMHFCLCVRALSWSQFLTDFDEIWHRRLEPNSRHDPWIKFAKRGRSQGHVTFNFLGVKCQ